MVQMVAEAVLVAIDPPGSDDAPVRVEAQFTMRNSGEATETMDVRFPLENPDGMGDGWGGRPTVGEFRASVEGRKLPIQTLEEPLSDDRPIRWATFPVAFPPGEDVRIDVAYSTRLTRSLDDPETARLEYILETRAGWYGTIGSAVISLRFPYAASPSNVFVTNLFSDGQRPIPVFVGREARWEWTDLEPTSKDNLSLTFVSPGHWNQILSLESETGERPSDVALAIRLAEAYLDAGSERHGFLVSEPLYRLAKDAILLALIYHPASLDLLDELLVLDVWRCNSPPGCEAGERASLVRAFDQRLAPDPGNERLLELGWVIESFRERQAATATEATDTPLTSTRYPTVRPLPTSTQTPLERPLAEPRSTPAVSVAPATSPGPPDLSILLVFVSGLAVGSAVSLGARSVIRRARPKS